MSNSEYLSKATKYYNAIKNILLKQWDPIGISGIPEADKREIKESVVKELERKSRDSSGKSMSPAEFSRWCDSL